MATREELKQVFANGQMATGEKFANLIDSMKVVQLPVVDPQALGTSLSFIDSISQDADGKITVTKKRMSPTVGSFQFVANDATAEAAFTAVGAKYSGAISGVSPSADTLGAILLMNDDDTTPTKTMMITTEEVTPATNPATYQFVYVGDLQSALPSGVLTAADIVNSFTGGVDKVLSAEAGKELSWRKNVMLDILDVDASTLTNIPYGVVDFGVTPGVTLPANDSEDYWVLNYCCCRLTGGDPRFRMKISNAQGNAVIEFNESISADTGRRLFSAGNFFMYVDCNWLKSRLLSSVESINARINPTKLTQTTVSVTLKRNYEIKSGNDLKKCVTGPSIAAKEVGFANFVLPSTSANSFGGNVGKIIMTNGNTAASGVTLNIGGTGAYPLFYNGAAVTDENTWAIGEVVDVYFDGTNYYATSVVPVSGGGGSSDDFVGTDGVSAGEHGLVPAPTATQKDYVLSANGGFVRNDGYLYNLVKNITTNSNRNQRFAVKVGQHINVRVTNAAPEVGSFSTLNLQWVLSVGGVESTQNIQTGLIEGYTATDLVVPENCTHLNVYASSAGTGKKIRVEIWDADKHNAISDYLSNIGGVNYLNARRIVAIDKTIAVSSSSQVIMTSNQFACYDWGNDTVFALVKCDAVIGTTGSINFQENDSENNTSVKSITALRLRDRNTFLVFENKEGYRPCQISVLPNTVTTEGNLHIELFAVDKQTLIQTHPLYGKKIMCFGDSITEYDGGDKTYAQYLQEISFATVYNAGNGGHQYAVRSGQELLQPFDICNLVDAWCENDFTDQDASIASGSLTAAQVARYTRSTNVLKNHPISEIDIITLMAGVNDYTNNIQLGSDALDNYDTTTEKGAINHIIKKILETNPKVKIYGFTEFVFMTGSVSLANSSDVKVHSDSADNILFPTFLDGVMAAYAKNNIPVFDMYHTIGWNTYNFSEYFRTGSGNVDLKHPYSGFYLIAERIYKFLCSK